MASYSIETADAHPGGLEQLEPLITEMYEYMGRHGLLVPLAEGGAAKLRRAMEQSLGRTGQLVLARRGADIDGFAYGMLRLMPAYLGGGVAGLIGHTFVREAARGHGVGAKMVAALEDWFVSKGATHLELQVLTGNTDAIRFWEKHGFVPELLQMRKLLSAKRD